MKKIKITLKIIFATIVFISCGNKREPGRVYMPDMAYSRAYEVYAPNNLKQEGINYITYPVDGTIRRGDLFAYTLLNDSNGYKMSTGVKSPLATLDSTQMLEAQRLFNINCAICHGANMDAQGPLAVSGKVGGIANLKLDQYIKQAEGQMYHVVTYGKGNMGSYAAQLDKKQRWMVVQYVKSEQTKGSAAAKDNSSSTTAAKDSTAKK
ncbi:MAG: cytochrome c [Chitinophagaceae bacterium]|nr:cytochrome c [Chitinophagaceae bacterium]